MNIDFKEIQDGEQWEFFARDFLSQEGLVIEIPPSRGADGGKDLIVSEQLNGRIASEKFTWLVSCKHFAVRGVSVGVSDEDSILERVKQHSSGGFMGFYSTVPSTALITRLDSLVRNGDLRAYTIFDSKRLEATFIEKGMSSLAIRYFPTSYKSFRPIQQFLKDYVPLKCDVCGEDVLRQSLTKKYNANILFPLKSGDPSRDHVYVVCKKDCDQTLTDRIFSATGCITEWQDLEDLTNPLGYLRSVMGYMNVLHSGELRFSKSAHDKIKEIYISVGQRTMREATQEDKDRVRDLIGFPF
ncbi:MAG: restriction endonuclease [Alphaproteobacteria bacterium]